MSVLPIREAFMRRVVGWFDGTVADWPYGNARIPVTPPEYRHTRVNPWRPPACMLYTLEDYITLTGGDS